MQRVIHWGRCPALQERHGLGVIQATREGRSRDARAIESMSTPTRSGSRGLVGRAREASVFLFVAPALVILLVFRVWPLVSAFRLSLTRWNGLSQPSFIGLQNYRDLWEDQRFRDALFNNIKLLTVLPVWVFLPFFIAQALFNKVIGWRFFRIALFLPAVLSPVVLGIYYGLVLRPDGPLNRGLSVVGIDSSNRDWLNDPRTAFPIMAAILVWSTLGVGVLIYLAGLSNMDTQLLEAAKIDGATWFQSQRFVVFWLMLPVVRFWSVIILIVSFTGIFPLVYALTRGGPGHSTYVVEFDIYQEAFQKSALGYSSAIGIALLGFVVLLLGILTRILRQRG